MLRRAAFLSRAGNAIAHRYERWIDASLDRRFGISTCGIDHDLVALGARGDNLAQANAYEPVQIPVFRAMMRAAAIDPRGYLFVDLGSGKGRALILAAEHGFKRMIGVEFAPVLHGIAARNVAAYARRRPSAGPIELHCADAAGFELPRADTMLFFYNTFKGELLDKVCRNIERSWRACPRRLVVAYRNPVHAEVLDAAPFLTRIAANPSFALYRAEPLTP